MKTFKYKISINQWGSRFTTVNGELHCEDGPAVRHRSNLIRDDWYLNDCWYSEEQFSEEKDKRFCRLSDG